MKVKLWTGIYLLAIVLLIVAMISLKPVGAADTKLRIISEVAELGPDNVIGLRFKVAVVVENVTDFYGFDIQMNWDTLWIHYVSHVVTVPADDYPAPNPPSPYEGALYNPVITVKDIVNESKGIPDADPETMAWFSYAAMAPAPGQNGNATVVVFEFEVVNQPFMTNSTIVIHFVETAISDTDGNPIIHDLMDLEIPFYGIMPYTKVTAISEVTQLGPNDVVGQTFKVAVVVENVTDFYGFDIQMNWTTEYIQYVNYSNPDPEIGGYKHPNVTVPADDYPAPNPPSPYEGALHKPTIPAKNVVNESKGIPDADPETMAWFAYASIDPAPPQDGNATIAVLTFKVRDQPLLPLNTTFIIHFVETALSNSTALPILHIASDLKIPFYGRPQPAGPILKVDPEIYNFEGPTPHTFDINISIYNLNEYWDLGGFDIQLVFDPRFAQEIDITEGEFIADYNFNFFNLTEINNTRGTIWVARLQDPEKHIIPSGNATLFTVTFNVKTCTPLAFTIGPSTGFAGYPHPERSESPYNNSEASVAIPYTSINGFANIIGVNDHIVTVEGVDYIITTRSNSSVQEVAAYAPTPMLRFTVEGLEGFGFCNVTIPKSLMWSSTVPAKDGWYVIVDGKLATLQIAEDSSNTYIYFTYEQSLHYVTMVTTDIIPEMGGLPTILLLLAVLTMATLITPKIAKRKNT